MKRKILFFVAVLLIFGCEGEHKVQRSDHESYPAEVDRLIIDTQQRAKKLGVEWTREEAEELRETFLGPSTAREKAEAINHANRKIAEQYRQRMKETIEERVKVGRSAMEKALNWRLVELERLVNDPKVNPSTQVKAHDMYYRLALNESSLLQSFEDQLREHLDQGGLRLPVNGELVACLKRACDWFEQCYRSCNVMDDGCWQRCNAGFHRRIAACPGMLPGVK